MTLQGDQPPAGIDSSARPPSSPLATWLLLPVGVALVGALGAGGWWFGGRTRAVDLTYLVAASATSTSVDGKDSAGAPVSYSVDRLIDGSMVTAWRMDGDGTGSSLRFGFERPVSLTAITITNGNTPEDPVDGTNRYLDERRITQVTWTAHDGSSYAQPLTDGVWAPQQIDLPAITTSHLILTIDSTTPPGDTSRDYTAISEIRFLGADLRP